MKNIIIKSVGYIIPIIALSLPVYSFPETTTSIDRQDGPIEVRYKSFEWDTQKSTITFLDDIETVTDDIKINCQKLVMFLSKNSTSNDVQTQIEKIEATEKVKISRLAGGTAASEKAVYYPDEKKVILMGNPVLKWGDSHMEDCFKITLDLNEGRCSCEAAEGGKAKAVIFTPKKEGGKIDRNNR